METKKKFWKRFVYHNTAARKTEELIVSVRTTEKQDYCIAARSTELY